MRFKQEGKKCTPLQASPGRPPESIPQVGSRTLEQSTRLIVEAAEAEVASERFFFFFWGLSEVLAEFLREFHGASRECEKLERAGFI